MRQLVRAACLAVAVAALWSASANTATAADTPLPQFYYYPYTYFPHNYWPAQSPKWPERPGEPYMRPPAYMAYPPIKEPNWRYDWLESKRYYRGHHFWLDQF